MKKNIVQGLVAVCLASSSGSAQSLPPVQTVATNPTTGSAYLLLEASNWYDAEAAAVALGGHLVTINDQAEQLWIKSTFQSCGVPIWIGITDAASEGSWAWVSGEPVSFTNWWPGEPNNYMGGITSFRTGTVDGAISLATSRSREPFPAPTAASAASSS